MAISMGTPVPAPLAPPVDPAWPLAAIEELATELGSPFALIPATFEPLPTEPPVAGNIALLEEPPVDPEEWLDNALQQGQLQIRASASLSAAATSTAMPGPGEPPATLAPTLASARPVLGPGLPAVAALPKVDLQRHLEERPVQTSPSRAAVSLVNEAGVPTTPVAVALASPASPGALPAAGPPMATPLPAMPAQMLEARWGERMVQTLQDNVRLQIQHNVQHATVRLDPPHLGTLELSVSHEAGRVEVRIHASNVEVARVLTHTSERLRHELTEQNFVQVSVSVNADAQGRHSSRQPPRPVPGEAVRDNVLAASDEVSTPSASTGSDVLVTV